MKKFLIITLLIPTLLHAQNSSKVLEALRIEKAPIIDGTLNESIWETADSASDFTMLYPGLGTPEPTNKKTIVKVLYDDVALYIAAYLLHDDPSAIPMQFTSRDSQGNSDFFEVSINTYNDKLNDTRFFVSSSGTQADAKIVKRHEDFSWNAVWESAVSIDDNGWYVEMKIPYSALRFSKEHEQEWGINFIRSIRNTREEFSWNFVDREKGNMPEYAGLLTGIKNINPPTRLSFYPFTQGLVKNIDNETTWKGAAGLDLKYGITESLTLDATLIPDFGQTAFDEEVLNLSPFEQHYEEKRAFFTEGTELFSKGNLLYTRRIGDTPAFYYNVESSLGANEEIIENPEKTKMLNAVKLSGKVSNGLGIGFFNAITGASYATIKNTETTDERAFLTNPLTNFNVLVIDKILPRSSSLSFVNSNVMRQGEYTDANVSSFLVDYKFKGSKYVVKSDLSMSNHFIDTDNLMIAKTGYKGKLLLKEILGSHKFTAGISLVDQHYNKQDLGYQEHGNYIRYSTSHSYRTYKPKGIYNSIYIGSQAILEYRQKPYVYVYNSFNSSLRLTTKKHLSYGLNLNIPLGYEYDYYETYDSNRYLKTKQSQYLGGWVSTNHRKTFALDVDFFLGYQFQDYRPRSYVSAQVSPRYRLNDRLQFRYSYAWNDIKNERSYLQHLADNTILFGNRRSQVFENTLNATFNFSTKSSFSWTARNYWVAVSYNDQLYNLQDNGALESSITSAVDDFNYNRWNLDMSYSWEFAPGSQLVALYRNGLPLAKKNDYNLHLLDVRQILDENASNEFSLKLIYYIDYNNIKNWF